MKKYVILLICFTFLFSCKNDQKTESKSNKPESKEKLNTDFEVHKEKLTPGNLEICDGEDCPQIKVDYVKIKTPSKFGKAFNEKNQTDLISIFNTTEEKTKVKSIKEAVENFIQDYFDYRKDFAESETEYEAEISQEIISRNDSLVVLKTDFYLFSGGAHGYGGTHFLNFDAKSGEFLTKDDLISDMSAFKDYAEKKFRKKFEIKSDATINAKGFFFENDKFALPDNIAVMPEKIILLYNPYEAASYAQGQIEMEFSKKEVGQWLKY
jgi:hypothetical protein